MREPRPLPVRVLSAAWTTLDRSRLLAMNLAFLLLVVGFVAVLVAGGPKVPDGGALLIAPKGDLVEQLSARSAREALSPTSSSRPETLLRDVLDALRAAKDDARIKVAVLDLDSMGGAGLSKLQEVRTALLAFKKAGKKLIATSDSYDQTSYYLASVADEVLLNPEGSVLLQGFSLYRMYYKDAIDRLGLELHVFRVGQYKSAVEPYLRNDASPEAKEADLDWMGDLWRSYLVDVAAARGKKPEELTALIDAYPERLADAGGDLAKLALGERLVDRLTTRDEVRERLVELAGADGDSSYRHVDVDDYLLAKGLRRPTGRGDGVVAVIVASGEILDGSQPPGRIGGDSTAALIRKAREDKAVKAVVLRVDSPGGSVFGSEVIRRELSLVRKAKKPVVVSMGTLAASGGYWISTASDEIFAAPTTITGSIGIFGIFPSYSEALAKHLGVHVDGVGTTWLAGALRPDRPLDPRVGQAIQRSIDRGYEDFLTRVAEARKMTRDQVDRIAQGRVWSGEDALRLGLVDKLGSLSDAISSAAARAKLGADYRVRWVEKDPTLKERVLSLLSARVTGLAEDGAEPRVTPFTAALLDLRAEADRLARFNDPHGLYAHCFCEVR